MASSGIRMVCPNPSCLNKAVVYRKPDNFHEPHCKLCKSRLRFVHKMDLRKINKAQIERELNVQTS